MKRLLIFALAALLIIPAFSLATPQLVSVHGKLTDTLNNPYSGSKNFILRIFTAQSGGTPLYTEFWNTTTQQVSLAAGGYFSVSPSFCLIPGMVYNFVLQAESAGKVADMYFRNAASTPSQNITCSTTSAACSFKNYAVSGWAMDSQTGGLINNGTVKVSVAETGDTFSTTFSNGYFSISPQFCLTGGRTYNFVLSVEGNGKSGIIKYARVGRG